MLYWYIRSSRYTYNWAAYASIPVLLSVEVDAIAAFGKFLAMRTELTPLTITEFQDRFGQLHDAVVYNINFNLFSQQESHSYTMMLRLGAPDVQGEPPDKWTDFTLQIEDVTEYVFKKKWNYESSILLKVLIGFFDEKIYLDFFPHNSLYHTASEFLSALDSNKSVLFMVAGKKCYWWI